MSDLRPHCSKQCWMKTQRFVCCENGIKDRTKETGQVSGWNQGISRTPMVIDK